MESSLFLGGVPIKNGRKEMGHWGYNYSTLISGVVFFTYNLFLGLFLVKLGPIFS